MPNIYTENCRSSERSRDLTTISTQMTHHWQHEHQYQLNSSSRSFAFSFCCAFFPSPTPVVVVFLFFWEFGDCWSRLPRTSKRYYQCAAAALVGHVNFCCCFPPPLSLPPPLCHSFSCSLTCHKPQVKKKKHFRILFVFHFVTIKQIINVKKQFMASAKLLPKLKPLAAATATATAIATFIDPL